MCISLPTIAPRSFIHYRKHYTNSAADSIFQQLTKHIHSYFAVLFAESHCTSTSAVGAWDCVNNTVTANRTAWGLFLEEHERSQPASLLVGFSSLSTNVTCDTLPRCEAGRHMKRVQACHELHSQILRSAHTVYLCVLCGSQNKQRLFPYIALTDWFL